MKPSVVIVAVLTAYPAWLAMMALHECGHVVHAWLSGGRVVSLAIPLLGFSFTQVSPNPHPALVAWGGPVGACVLPAILAAGGFALSRSIGRGLLAFLGFCLIANGAYLACGGFLDDGDAADLRRLGVPMWMLIGVGSALSTGGLWLWHALTGTRVSPHRGCPSD